MVHLVGSMVCSEHFHCQIHPGVEDSMRFVRREGQPWAGIEFDEFGGIKAVRFDSESAERA